MKYIDSDKKDPSTDEVGTIMPSRGDDKGRYEKQSLRLNEIFSHTFGLT